MLKEYVVSIESDLSIYYSICGNTYSNQQNYLIDNFQLYFFAKLKKFLSNQLTKTHESRIVRVDVAYESTNLAIHLGLLLFCSFYVH